MKKALTTVLIIFGALLFIYTCFLGIAAMSWASEMKSMTHFDLDHNPPAKGEETLKFYTDTGLCYEAVAVPDGITQAMLTEGLSLDKYDETVTAEYGMEYRLYHDPLQTGEGYVLIVPAVGSFNLPFTTVNRPLGYYAKEIK